MRIRLISAVAVLAVFFGCSSGGDADNKGNNDEPSHTSTSTRPNENAAADNGVAAELSAVIKWCLNPFAKTVQTSLRDYMYVTKGAKTFPEKPVRGPTVNKLWADPEKCATAAKSIASTTPKLPGLEAAASKYARAVKQLALKIESARAYYSQKDYKDDKFAKAKLMHGPLMTATNDYAAARRSLNQAVTGVQVKLEESKLAKLKNDPARKLDYLLLDSMIAGKNLLANARSHATKQSNNTSLSNNAKRLVSNASSLRTHLKSNPQKAIQAARFRRFLSSVDQLALAGKELARASGTPKQVVASFNNMVRSYNSL